MSTLSDNKDKHERGSMPFPFRWRWTLEPLSDGDFREIVNAILDYGETGNAPQFAEGWKAALWCELAALIDFEHPAHAGEQ